MNDIKIPFGRLKFVFLAIFLVFSFIILRMFYVVLTKDKSSIKNIYESRKNTRRADIYDRNGVLLATDLNTKSLYVSSVLVRDVKSVARAISDSFPDLKYEDVYKKIADGKASKHWILIRRNLTPSQD